MTGRGFSPALADGLEVWVRRVVEDVIEAAVEAAAADLDDDDDDGDDADVNSPEQPVGQSSSQPLIP